jgi:DNA-binding response OmpR family regulator
MLRQLVHRLRLKIAEACGAEDKGPAAVYIETVAGLGYGLTVPSAPD